MSTTELYTSAMVWVLIIREPEEKSEKGEMEETLSIPKYKPMTQNRRRKFNRITGSQEEDRKREMTKRTCLR